MLIQAAWSYPPSSPWVKDLNFDVWRNFGNSYRRGAVSPWLFLWRWTLNWKRVGLFFNLIWCQFFKCDRARLLANVRSAHQVSESRFLSLPNCVAKSYWGLWAVANPIQIRYYCTCRPNPHMDYRAAGSLSTAMSNVYKDFSRSSSRPYTNCHLPTFTLRHLIPLNLSGHLSRQKSSHRELEVRRFRTSFPSKPTLRWNWEGWGLGWLMRLKDTYIDRLVLAYTFSGWAIA